MVTGGSSPIAVGTTAALTEVLDALHGLVDDRDRASVEELQRRANELRLRVLVVGEAKRGKSTVLNALLGRTVLPTGVVPLTAVATTVRHGSPEGVEVVFADGSAQNEALAALPLFVTERENPHNVRRVTAVTVSLDAPLLVGGVEFVDTPGTGSVFEHNTVEATASLTRMDVALFVFSVDPPVTAAERDWLRQVRRDAVRVICVLNKVDYLAETEVVEAAAFTRDILAAELGHDAPLWPVSARRALAAAEDGAGVGDPQWDAFLDALRHYLATHARDDLGVSIARRGAAIARSCEEEAAASLAALALDDQQLAERLGQFRAHIDLVSRDRLDAVAIVDASVERLITDNAAQADELFRTVGPTLADEVASRAEMLEGPLRQIEEQLIEGAGDRIRETVEQWRSTRTEELAAAVVAMDRQLREHLDRHIRAVRDAASDLFDVALPAPLTVGRLVETRPFRYALGPDIGQTEALAASVRTHLPGKLGLRQVQRYTRDRALVLLDRQLGRVRADFAERLRETGRQLRRVVDTEYDAGAGRIAAAVEAVAAQRQHHAEQAGALRGPFEAKVEAARSVGLSFETFLRPSGPTQVDDGAKG